nr:uncharacterized protein LOC123751301 [Procambarus clarkii]
MGNPQQRQDARPKVVTIEAPILNDPCDRLLNFTHKRPAHDAPFSTSPQPKLNRMSPPPAKKRCQSNEEDFREFKEYWTEKFGMIKKDDKALCIFCSDTVVCRTSSVKRHFENVHKNLSNKTEEEQRELISRELSKTKTQAETFMNYISGRPSSNLVAASFEVSKVIAQHGKPLCDGEYIKEAWLECAPFLFDNFSEKKKIIQRIKGL